MLNSKCFKTVLLVFAICNAHIVQANTNAPWLKGKTAAQIIADPLINQEMQNIREQTMCESFLYQGDDPKVLASSANYVGIDCPIARQFITLDLQHEIVPVNSRVEVGSMYRFTASGNDYILGLRGDLTSCDQQIKSSVTHLKTLL